MTNNEQVAAVLQSLQQAMQHSGDWSDSAIHPDALNSQQPFCLDTMNFSQWLQFVFIVKIQVIINAGEELPRLIKGQGIGPMASEFYNRTETDRAILSLVRQLDCLLQY